MAYTGFTKPTNRIIGAGKPLVQELKIETATSMYAGRLVKKGTNDDDIVVNTANNSSPIGWLGWEQANPAFRPSTVDTIYVTDAMAPVVSGGGFTIVARLASGQSVVKGAPLVAAASGELTAATITSVATGATTVTSSAANGAIITGSMLPQGPIVGYAEETVDASGAAADILVRSVI